LQISSKAREGWGAHVTKTKKERKKIE